MYIIIINNCKIINHIKFKHRARYISYCIYEFVNTNLTLTVNTAKTKKNTFN
jgi:hypothetical protein